MTITQDPFGKQYGVEHILFEEQDQAHGSLSAFLRHRLKFRQTEVNFLLQMGAIYLNDSRIQMETSVSPLKLGDYLRVHTQPRRFPTENLHRLEVVFEHEHFVVINKPSGVPVHPTVDNQIENCLAALSAQLGCKLFVTHRLDMATSGLLVFAKTKEFQSQFNQMLARGAVKKWYRALVHGHFEGPAELVHFMGPSPRAPKTVSAQTHPNWAPCRLKVHDSEPAFQQHSQLVIELLTGRTHQIRAQLSFEGFPIVGDRMYGSPVKLAEHERIALQAFCLQFPNPFIEEKDFSFKLLQTPWSLALSN
jgi:23S rRNA pseudouridine1911/1915/1917 synthase